MIINKNVVDRRVYYPESDGEPIAENTRQFEYICTIQGGLDSLYCEVPDIFVAGDNFWYPVEGHPEIRTAPDIYVVFGRPKVHRPSYKQWEEGGIAPQVVFEILSPGNRGDAMFEKMNFYGRYGVDEYYIYDPDFGLLEGYLRTADKLTPVIMTNGFVSPRLGVRFELEALDLKLFYPDGKPFETYVQLFNARTAEANRANEERLARLQAQKRADIERERADRLAARLVELGIDPKQL